MSTIKISELTSLLHLDTNTSNTLIVGVDFSTGQKITGNFTVKTLSEGLYANNILNVGNNEILFPGVIGQFISNNESYLQLNLENNNANGSGDLVVTADIGTDTTHFIDMGINGSNYNYDGTQPFRPVDGYLVVQGGSTDVEPGGNLLIGTITTNRNVEVSLGGVSTENVVAQFLYNTGFKLTQKPLLFADGTSQNTSSEGASSYANSAFDTANSALIIAQTPSYKSNSAESYANSAFLKANSAVTNAATADSKAVTAGSYANAAFLKANTALANTSGIFAGDLTFTGNVIARSISTTNLISFVGAGTPATNALVEIIGSANGIQQVPSNDGYMLHITGKANTPARLVVDSFGANAYTLIAGRSGRGTAVAPTAIANNDVLLRISSNGWGTTGFAPLGSGRIDFVAAENYTDTARGSRIEMYNVITGSNTINKIASFNANTVEFMGTVNPQKGFIFSPRIPNGNQTAIVIDFSSDSTITANLIADLAITMNNYTAGKIVEVWLTNNDNANRTVTHGVAALRSTTKSTTFTIISKSSAYLRYFSIDGDNANTFVTINA